MQRFKRSKKKFSYATEPIELKEAHKHPFVLPVLTFFVLFFVSCWFYINLGAQTIGANDSRVVQVSVDGKQQTIPTRAQSVGDLLKRLNIEIKDGDVVEPPLDTPIVTNDFHINVYKAQPVTVEEAGHKTLLSSPITDPRAVATKAGYTLYPEDTVTLASSDDALKDGVLGQKLVIDRATPVKLNLYGQTVDLRTHAKTVRELLKERKIDDTKVSVLPTLDTPLQNDSAVFVTDIGKEVQIIEVEIPQGQTFVDDYNLTAGKTEVRDPGKPGKKVLVYDAPKGQLDKKHILQEVLVSNPVDKVVARGRKINTASVAGDKAALMSQAGISANEYYAVDYIISHESGWKPGSVSGSGCAGLGQSCPGTKIMNACPNWSENAVCQLQYYTKYAQKYGGWEKAYFVWQTQGWW
jgi:uncharacterized protein YabE (DUF348 family)